MNNDQVGWLIKVPWNLVLQPFAEQRAELSRVIEQGLKNGACIIATPGNGAKNAAIAKISAEHDPHVMPKPCANSTKQRSRLSLRSVSKFSIKLTALPSCVRLYKRAHSRLQALQDIEKPPGIRYNLFSKFLRDRSVK